MLKKGYVNAKSNWSAICGKLALIGFGCVCQRVEAEDSKRIALDIFAMMCCISLAAGSGSASSTIFN